MKIALFLSPSKTQIEQNISKEVQEPLFLDKAKSLAKPYIEMDLSQLQHKQDLSDKKAEEVYQIWQKWGKEKGSKSIELYSGPAFNGLAYTNSIVKSKDIDLFILSALYGMLRPQDVIWPYRLDFSKNHHLYKLWKPLILEHIKKCKYELLIDLASNEYSKLLPDDDIKRLRIDIKEYRGNQWKSISYNGKYMRGRIANWLLSHPYYDYKRLKEATIDDYCLNQKLSSETLLVFSPIKDLQKI
ncbi:YaaA family protein [Spirochaeta cellobiosiphila]|uniref:YaaA family protein n=1 Tax=Spirochaeta cellobiosiphila TaxID=504483 RepID=UPI000413BC93|nr:YaaA family protein [Spirochaeta cellobiosiphila]